MSSGNPLVALLRKTSSAKMQNNAVVVSCLAIFALYHLSCSTLPWYGMTDQVFDEDFMCRRLKAQKSKYYV